jgi:uncharacterized protein (DUF1501 family)
MLQPVVDVGITHAGVISRRGFLRAGAALACGFAGLSAFADQVRKAGKSCILLWMDGGPSQFDTFNPKPDSPSQGPAKAISTSLAGVQFAEYWPKTAQFMDKIALIRSMKSKEAEHDRAIALARTGYPLTPALRYPTFGSVVAMKRADANFDLPAFVRIGKPRIATRDVDHGVLGVKYSAFKIDEPGKLPPNVTPGSSADVLQRRLKLAGRFDAEFARAGGSEAVSEKQAVYDRASLFVLSPRFGTFDLARESDKLRDAYGRSSFGQGCLLARRLVEQGVSFVEVISTGSRNDQGWDTHHSGFADTPPLCAETDPAYAALLTDLAERGLLENTLVVWMGEFGRSPKFKPDGGRDHYPTGWITALAGGGVKGGQVIGATDKNGIDVTDRPVGISDLFVSFCKVLGIDSTEEYKTSDQRPIALVEGGQVIRELL